VSYNDIPWAHRTIPVPGLGSRLALVVEGDIANLDRMFADLPDRHRHDASHGTPESIDRHIRESGNPEFYQAQTYREVLQHATVIGRNDVTELVTEHLTDPEMREIIHMSGTLASRPRAVFGDEGDEVDMDRMFAGQEDTAWRRIERFETMRQSRVVVVDVNIICAAWTSQEEFVWNGVQTAVIVDALEAEGYRVEVNALQALSMNDRSLFCSRVRIKRADEPLRLDLLAYQTGCAAMARAALWRCIHVHNGSIAGYGINDLSGHNVRVLAHTAAPEGHKPDHILPLVLSRPQAVESIKRVVATYHANQQPVA
jgi:hypothetical protein